MLVTVLIARLLLSVVFGAAGLAKIADLSGSRKAVADSGIPTWLANPLGVLLPFAELAIAILLVPIASFWWAGSGALLLLLVFGATITINLLRGRKPDCHCFGQLHSKPIGWATLVRALMLALIAVLIVSSGRTQSALSFVSALQSLTISQALGLAFALVFLGLLVAEGYALIHVLRQNGKLLLRIEKLESRLGTGAGPLSTHVSGQAAAGLPVGSVAPRFQLPQLSDDEVTLEILLQKAKPVVLIFSDPNCGPCDALSPEMARWQQQYPDILTLAVVSRGTAETNVSNAAKHGLQNVLIQQDREVAESYRAYGTPSAVLVQTDGTIGSPVASGAQAISHLIARSTGPEMPKTAAPSSNGHHRTVPARSKWPNLRIGDAAPSFALPDLSGNRVALADFNNRNTLVLFWNPECGFCKQMIPDLKAWERESPEKAPDLLVVSIGSAEINRAMELRSTVVLDESFTVGRAFGARGTPSAVLVDLEGKIASSLVVGAPNILALTRAEGVHRFVEQ